MAPLCYMCPSLIGWEVRGPCHVSPSLRKSGLQSLHTWNVTCHYDREKETWQMRTSSYKSSTSWWHMSLLHSFHSLEQTHVHAEHQRNGKAPSYLVPSRDIRNSWIALLPINQRISSDSLQHERCQPPLFLLRFLRLWHWSSFLWLPLLPSFLPQNICVPELLT